MQSAVLHLRKEAKSAFTHGSQRTTTDHNAEKLIAHPLQRSIDAINLKQIFRK